MPEANGTAAVILNNGRELTRFMREVNEIRRVNGTILK